MSRVILSGRENFYSPYKAATSLKNISKEFIWYVNGICHTGRDIVIIILFKCCYC